MKNETNIYDIDGEIIREAGDNHKMTIEEAQKRMSDYAKKAEENPEKAEIYKSYIRNLSNYVYNLLSMMSKDEFTEYVSKTLPNSTKTKSEDVEKALNDMSEELKSVSQEDMMVERDTEAPVMDEYVSPIEEESKDE